MSTAVAENRARAVDPALVAGFHAARAICRRQFREFYLPAFFLPKHKRDAAFVVGAFCLMMRDAIVSRELESDASSCSSEEPAARAQLFRERLDEIYSGAIELPNAEFRSESQHVLAAISHTVQRFEIPRQYFLNLAEGYRTEATVARHATWRSLENHLSTTGGAITLILSCVLGLTHSDAGRQAMQLGNAMQLTSMLRDIRSDRSRGRVYPPLEDLVRFHYSEKDLAARTVNEHFRELMRFETARARQLYREGAECICWLAGDGSRLSASLQVAIHSSMLDEIERRGFDVFGKRAELSALQKARCLPLAWKLARRQSGEPIPL